MVLASSRLYNARIFEVSGVSPRPVHATRATSERPPGSTAEPYRSTICGISTLDRQYRITDEPVTCRRCRRDLAAGVSPALPGV